MACCGRKRKVIAAYTAAPSQLNRPQNFNALNSPVNQMLCTKCGGNMQVQRTYRSGDTTKANISCTVCGTVRIIYI